MNSFSKILKIEKRFHWHPQLFYQTDLYFRNFQPNAGSSLEFHSIHNFADLHFTHNVYTRYRRPLFPFFSLSLFFISWFYMLHLTLGLRFLFWDFCHREWRELDFVKKLDFLSKTDKVEQIFFFFELSVRMLNFLITIKIKCLRLTIGMMETIKKESEPFIFGVPSRQLLEH